MSMRFPATLVPTLTGYQDAVCRCDDIHRFDLSSITVPSRSWPNISMAMASARPSNVPSVSSSSSPSDGTDADGHGAGGLASPFTQAPRSVRVSTFTAPFVMQPNRHSVVHVPHGEGYSPVRVKVLWLEAMGLPLPGLRLCSRRAAVSPCGIGCDCAR
eukprot:scaffold1124_cov361-Prasinococcus_capsulatus_cf.AAC.24